MPWSVIIDDTFARADTTAGAAGTTTGGGNGWIDVQGGVATINGNRLYMTTDVVDGSQYIRDFLLRPTGENQQDSRLVFKTAVGGSAVAQWAVILRRQAGGDRYILGFDSGQYHVFKIVAGAVISLANAVPTGFNAAHVYQSDFTAVGINPTVLTATLTDLTTSTVVATVTANDSAASLQTTGQFGLYVTTANGTAVVATARYAEVATYGPGVALGTPTIAFVSATDTTINLQASVSGGTAPITGQWYRDVHDPVTIGAPTLLGGATSLTLADSAGLVAGTIYYYRYRASDAVPSSADSLTFAASLWKKPLVIGFIGDSVTSGWNGAASVLGQAPPVQVAALLPHARGPRQVAVANQGISGTATGDWLPAGGNYTTAVAAFAAASVTHVHICLGHNDSKAATVVSAATFKANLLATCNALVAAGYKVILSYPVWIDPAGSLSPTFTDASLQAMIGYMTQIDSLLSGATVLRGDVSAWTWAAANRGAYGLADGAHFSPAGYALIGDFWAESIAKAALDAAAGGVRTAVVMTGGYSS